MIDTHTRGRGTNVRIRTNGTGFLSVVDVEKIASAVAVGIDANARLHDGTEMIVDRIDANARLLGDLEKVIHQGTCRRNPCVVTKSARKHKRIGIV